MIQRPADRLFKDTGKHVVISHSSTQLNAAPTTSPLLQGAVYTAISGSDDLSLGSTFNQIS